MKCIRVVMEIVVDVDSDIREDAMNAMLRSLQENINRAIITWGRPMYIGREEILIRTTGWSQW